MSILGGITNAWAVLKCGGVGSALRPDGLTASLQLAIDALTKWLVKTDNYRNPRCLENDLIPIFRGTP